MPRLKTLTPSELADLTKKVFEKKVKLMLRFYNRNQILTIADKVLSSQSQDE